MANAPNALDVYAGNNEVTGCEAMVGLALFACLARNPACLPPEYARYRDDLAGIVEEESKWNPYAIRDETTNESLFPATRAEAVRQVNRRIATGNVLGLGLTQITGKANREFHGLTPIDLLNPCKALKAGARHYAGDMSAAAMRRYNGGNRGMAGLIPASNAYAVRVTARVERLRPALSILSVPTRVVPTACPGAPPRWDAWGSSRHAARCAEKIQTLASNAEYP